MKEDAVPETEAGTVDDLIKAVNTHKKSSEWNCGGPEYTEW